MTDNQSTLGLETCRLFQIVSPSLPIGAFTYSQGLEWAVEAGWVTNIEETRQWLDSILQGNMTYLELPVIMRLHQALQQNNSDAFHYWSSYLLSCRETAELRLEERQRAQAFLRFLQKLPDSQLRETDTLLTALQQSQSAGYCLACYQWDISLEQALLGYSWSWLESMVNTAVKLVPLGQTEGQALLFQLSTKLPEKISYSMSLADEELGAGSTAMAIASSLHETQYCRLYRS